VGIVALIGGAIGGTGWLLFGSDALRYRHLRVVGNVRASEAQLAHLADLPLDTPLLLLDLGAAIKGVEQHPWVAHASARRVFPDTVVLQVQEREVKALLMLDGLYLVDADGVPFRRADAGDLDHPVITGLAADLADKEPDVARRIVADALGLLDGVRGRGRLQETDVSEVRFDPDAGYTLALRNGGEVLLGFQKPPSADAPPDAPRTWDRAFARLDALVANGVDLTRPYRVDLGSDSMAVVSPLQGAPPSDAPPGNPS
jgi:hypothetical protein